MNKVIGQYVQEVKTLFPIMGKPEKNFLGHLGSHIEEYFAQQGPASVDEIIQRYGPPEEVVSNYFSQTDVDYMIKRIRLARRCRVCLAGLLTVLVIVMGICTHAMSQTYQWYAKTVDEGTGYFVEEIIE